MVTDCEKARKKLEENELLGPIETIGGIVENVLFDFEEGDLPAMMKNQAELIAWNIYLGGKCTFLAVISEKYDFGQKCLNALDNNYRVPALFTDTRNEIIGTKVGYSHDVLPSYGYGIIQKKLEERIESTENLYLKMFLMTMMEPAVLVDSSL